MGLNKSTRNSKGKLLILKIVISPIFLATLRARVSDDLADSIQRKSRDRFSAHFFDCSISQTVTFQKRAESRSRDIFR